MLCFMLKIVEKSMVYFKFYVFNTKFIVEIPTLSIFSIFSSKTLFNVFDLMSIETMILCT